MFEAALITANRANNRWRDLDKRNKELVINFEFNLY
jgi:hypothetical protein